MGIIQQGAVATSAPAASTPSYRFIDQGCCFFSLFAVVCGLSAVSAQRVLALPDPKSCAKRVKHASWTDPLGTTHNYFFSWLHKPTAELEVDWLDARNICRRHCMDAVSLETLQENEFVKSQMARYGVKYIWTSGRKCDFDGCDRSELQPLIINGWFWSGSEAKIPPTDQPLWEIGLPPEVTSVLNPTTVKMMRENLAWPS